VAKANFEPDFCCLKPKASFAPRESDDSKMQSHVADLDGKSWQLCNRRRRISLLESQCTGSHRKMSFAAQVIPIFGENDTFGGKGKGGRTETILLLDGSNVVGPKVFPQKWGNQPSP